MKANPTRKITRLQFGELLASAWVKSATISNAVAAFKATDIVPFNPEAIPDDAFLSESLTNPIEIPLPEKSSTHGEQSLRESSPQPGCSTLLSDSQLETSVGINDLTPGKMLSLISPIPSTSTPVQQARMRSKQIAAILNSEESISNKKSKQEAKRKISNKAAEPQTQKIKILKGKSKRVSRNLSSESEAGSISLDDSSDGNQSEEEYCRGCNEAYSTTKKKDDWLKCIRCLSWYHETCSDYTELCVPCSKLILRKKKPSKK